MSMTFQTPKRFSLQPVSAAQLNFAETWHVTGWDSADQLASPAACGQGRLAAQREAAEALLDRGWGKPKQSHEAEIEHRYVVEIPPQLSNEEWQEKYGPSSIPVIDLKMIRQY
jgi:hypothetical protein